MIIERLITNYLNLNKKYLSAKYNGDTIFITYRLSVPSWCNDNKFLSGNPNRKIVYASSKKYSSNTVTISHNAELIDGSLPIGKNKFYCETLNYPTDTFSKVDIDQFVYQEYQNVFRELNSNILLEKIGFLSKQFDAVTSGKNNVPEPIYPFRHPVHGPCPADEFGL